MLMDDGDDDDDDDDIHRNNFQDGVWGAKAAGQLCLFCPRTQHPVSGEHCDDDEDDDDDDDDEEEEEEEEEEDREDDDDFVCVSLH